MKCAFTPVEEFQAPLSNSTGEWVRFSKAKKAFFATQMIYSSSVRTSKGTTLDYTQPNASRQQDWWWTLTNVSSRSHASITFLGHIIDAHEVSVDPSKTSAVLEMEMPRAITELHRFMGMGNQLGKFTPRNAEISQPLCKLLSSKRAWMCGPTQDGVFKKIKAELARRITLALYNLGDPTRYVLMHLLMVWGQYSFSNMMKSGSLLHLHLGQWLRQKGDTYKLWRKSWL